MKQLNPYGLTEKEVLDLEACADFLNDLTEIRLSRCAENDTEGYTWERVKQPKSNAPVNVSTDE